MLMFERQREARAQTFRLVTLFMIMTVLLCVAVNLAMAALWWVFWGVWHAGFARLPAYWVETTTGLVLLYVLGGWWLETSRIRNGGGIRLAEHMGARRLNASSDFDERRFENIVNEMSLASGLKPPTPMVMARDLSINAFATGWDEDDAVIAITRGALEFLTREELQGLVAHEFSHILEGDTRLSMRLAGMVMGVELIHQGGHALFDPDWQPRNAPMALLGLVLMGVGWIGWVAGRLLQAAVSRQREYLADARAVQWTRSKEGLGAVLRKVAGQRAEAYEPLQTTPPAFAHLLLAGEPDASRHRWLDVHPPLEERIRRIYGVPMPPISPRRVDERVVFA